MSEVEVGTSAPEPTVIANTEASPIEATMAEVYDKLNPARETNGQFKGDKPVEAESTEDAPAETESVQEPIAEVKEPEKTAIPRPQSWSSDVDELWAKLPPEAKDIIAKREGEAHKRITELGEVAKSFEPVKPHLEQLRRAESRMGLPPGKGLELLLAADDYLARDPVAAIQWMAQQAGVDLSRFGQVPQGGTSESPQVDALMQRIHHLEGQLNQTTHRIQSREQQEQIAHQNSLNDLVENFTKGKDYWPQIENDVQAQIAAIRTMNPNMSPSEVLQKAHDNAIKLNDEVRNKLTEAKRKEEDAKKAADQKRKAEEAKRLASLNVRSVEGKAPKASFRSLEDEMASIYDKVASRG